MLTIRENLLETIRGGNPDRFVNQYEFMDMIIGSPFGEDNPNPKRGEMNVPNAWGIIKSWPEHVPGAFPVHTPDKIVIKDIENWRDYVKVPSVVYPEERWAPYIERINAVDRTQKFATCFVAPGVFEQCHYLMEIQNCLMAFYEYPDEMHELIDMITEWELAYAAEICKYLKPDAIFHHDDWGSQISTFISPEMFHEFYTPAYKKIYGYYKEHGVQLIVHHSDSFAATLVPEMIEMGIDIWQGVMTTNNIPELIKKYGGQISFMGGIDSATIDFPGWTEEDVKKQVERCLAEHGKHYFIPGASLGLATSNHPGVYECTAKWIDEGSKKYF